jgi:hypothetical protein
VQLDIRCPNYLILSIDAFILNQELPSNLINKRTDIMRLNSNQFQFLGTNKIGPRRGVVNKVRKIGINGAAGLASFQAP